MVLNFFRPGAVGGKEMTLYGKILKIKWEGEFKVTVDGVTRFFDDPDKMHDWFSRIIARSKDDRKRQLLIDDLKHIMLKTGH